MQKNVTGQKVIVFAFDATTNLPKSGDAANISAYISKDFGAVTQLTDTSATEMDATNAKGYYLFDITQTETNADVILVSGKSVTSNIVVIGAPATVFTQPANFTTQVIDGSGRVDVSKLAGQTVTAAAGVTFPSSVASPTNITAATGITVATNNDKTGYSIAAGGIGSGAHAAAELNAIADATLDRNMATGTDSGSDSTTTRTVRQALRASRNKVAIVAGTMTTYKEDDSTASWTAAVTTTAGNPISTLDPT